MQHPNGHFKNLEKTSSDNGLPLMIESISPSSSNLFTEDLSSTSSSFSSSNGNNFIYNWFSKRHVTSHLTPRHFLITLDTEDSHSERDIANKLYNELSKMRRPLTSKDETSIVENVKITFSSVVNTVKKNVIKTQQVIREIVEFVEEIGREESHS